MSRIRPRAGSPTDRDQTQVFAAATPAVVVLLLGELAHRFAAQLFEDAAGVAHVEEKASDVGCVERNLSGSVQFSERARRTSLLSPSRCGPQYLPAFLMQPYTGGEGASCRNIAGVSCR